MTTKIVRSDGTTISNIKSCVYTEKVNADTDLCPGCVASASINVEVYGAQADAPTAGEELTYYQVQDGTETLIGVFYAEPSIPSKNTYAFTAYDAVSKLDVGFSERLAAIQNSFPMTLNYLVAQVCTVAGVTLTGTVPMGTMEIQAFYADGITCRQVMSWAAEIACRFVRCDTSGSIKFDWYTTVTDYRITPGGSSTEENVTWVPYKQDGLQYENYETETLARVAVHPTDEEQIAYVYPASVTSGNTLDIYNNILLTGADESVYMAVAQNIYTTMHALGTYSPAQISLFPFLNPFRAGQIVPVTDIQGVSFFTPIMSMTVQASDVRLESTGNETYSGTSSTIQEALVNLADNIVRLKRLKVDWADITTAVIQTLEAEGINADWIDAGALTVKIGSRILFQADQDTKIVSIGNFTANWNNAYSLDGKNATLSLTDEIGLGNGSLKAVLSANGLVFYCDDWQGGWEELGSIRGSTFLGNGIMCISAATGQALYLEGRTIYLNTRDVLTEIGALSSLSTTAKTSLVAAVNEVVSAMSSKANASLPTLYWRMGTNSGDPASTYPHVELRNSGSSTSGYALSLVYYASSSSSTFNNLINVDGSRNWITPSELAVTSGTLTLSNGTLDSSAYIKKTGNVVVLNFVATGVTVSAGSFVTIGTVPSGYRPAAATRGAATAGYAAAHLMVLTGGGIQLRVGTAVSSAQVVGNLTWTV